MSETDLIIQAYKVDWEFVKQEKCSECNEDRIVTYVSTNGKEIKQGCDCAGGWRYYVKKVNVLTKKGMLLIANENLAGCSMDEDFYEVAPPSLHDYYFTIRGVQVYRPDKRSQSYEETIFLNKNDAEQFAEKTWGK